MSITVRNFTKPKRVVSCATVFVDNTSILDTYDKKYKKLDCTTFGEKYNLIINSSLYNLPSIKNSFPTCFIIKNDNGKILIVTAKHVLDYCLIQTMSTSLTELFTKISIVFGYDDDTNNHSVKTKEIFKIKGIYNDTYNDAINSNDFVILEIENPENLNDKVIGKISKSEIELNSKIYALGYPYGMPLYTSYGTLYCEAKNKKGYYITDLSAFNGHSGAPVFNAENEIIGLIFGGASDFEIVSKNVKGKNKSFKRLRYRKFHLENENGIFILPINCLLKYL